MNERDRLYRAYPIIKEIDDESGGMISAGCIFKKLAADEYMSSKISGCSGLVLVIRGNIKIQRISEDGGETNLYNISKGEICHEALSCYLQNKPLNIVGRALCDTEVCMIPFEDIKKYLVTDYRFMTYIYKDLHNKLNYIIDNKEQIRHESVKERLIRKLISYNTKTIYITHGELAFELDSAREVISRKLKAMEKEGYVTLKRGRIIIEKNLNDVFNK